MALFVLFGLYALLAQALLLREISQVFGAHELSLAAALAWWLLWTAAGVRLGGRSQDEPAFRRGLLIFAAAAPLNLALVRLAPGFLSPLVRPGLFSMLAGSALLCLPAALANGYAAGAALRNRPALFYAAEAGGAALGGLLTLGYYRYFPSLEAALLLLLPGAALPLFYARIPPVRPGRVIAAAAACMLVGATAVLAPRLWTLKPPAPRPERTIQTEGSRFSLSGGLVYEDGSLLRAAEDNSPERLAHLPLLTLRRPGKVLLHGGAAFFLLPEVLENKPEAVEIAEPDRFRAALLTDLSGIKEEEFTLLDSDPRALEGKKGRYSALIHAGGPPENAAQNRFYTAEYFRKAAALLEPGGILAFTLPFSANYIPPQTAYAAACVLAAAKEAFPRLELIPGTPLVVLASDKDIELDAGKLTARYKRRGIKNREMVPSAFPFMLSPYRRAWAAAAIAKVKDPPPNTDLNPLAYFRFWRAWLSMVMAPSALLGLAGLGVAGLFAAWKLKGSLRFSPEERTGEAFLMGFWGLSFETAVLLAFQARTGRLSPELGAMFALFMAGAAAGAWLARNAPPSRLPFLEAAGIALALAGALLPQLAQDPWSARLLILCGGVISGAFFSAAAGRTGPSIYSWDLIGGAAGGLAVAGFAAPIAGISGALYLSAAAAAGALAGCFAARFSSSSKASAVKV